MLVKTKLGPSRIHGLGLFAAEFIQKGKPVWEFTKGLDLRFTEEELQKLPELARENILHYCYHDIADGAYVLCFDDGRFFNHSENPNVGDIEVPGREQEVFAALHDIQVGEELTCNYREFDIDCREGLESYC